MSTRLNETSPTKSKISFTFELTYSVWRILLPAKPASLGAGPMAATKGYCSLNVIRTLSTLRCCGNRLGYKGGPLNLVECIKLERQAMTIKGIFIIKSFLRGQDALILGPGPDQNLVNSAQARPEGIRWRLTPSGDNDGVIMESVAFKTFLKVDPKENNTRVTTGAREQATSFAVTPAGDGAFHIKVVTENLAWTASHLTVEESPVTVQRADGGQGQLWQLIQIDRID